MGVVRDTTDDLYKSDALLGFAISSEEGELIHNESFFSDEAAHQALTTFRGALDQLAVSGRVVNRLTVELEDVLVIYMSINDQNRRGMFIFKRSCDLDGAAKVLDALAA